MNATIPILIGVLALPLPAQFDRPDQKIREVAEAVAKQLEEIDRMLLESGAKGGTGSAQSGEVNELLERTKSNQQGVVDKLDELIEELRKQQGNQSRSQSSSSNPSGRRPRDQRQESSRQPSGRRPPRGQNQPDDNQQQKPEPSQNRPAAKPPDDATERLLRERDLERWGELQLYEDFLKNRGGRPKVPERYRRFHEAFQKRSAKRKK